MISSIIAGIIAVATGLTQLEKYHENWTLYRTSSDLLKKERDSEIKKAIKNSRYFIALLSSNSVAKIGYVQKELKYALEEQDKFPESGTYLIPVRLDHCEMPYEKLKNSAC